MLKESPLVGPPDFVSNSNEARLLFDFFNDGFIVKIRVRLLKVKKRVIVASVYVESKLHKRNNAFGKIGTLEWWML